MAKKLTVANARAAARKIDKRIRVWHDDSDESYNAEAPDGYVFSWDGDCTGLRSSYAHEDFPHYNLDHMSQADMKQDALKDLIERINQGIEEE